MKKIRLIALLTMIGIALAGLYYYVALPPINIHAPGFWWFVIVVLLIAGIGTAIYGIDGVESTPDSSRKEHRRSGKGRNRKAGAGYRLLYKSQAVKYLFLTLISATLLIIAIFLIGSLLSSEIINAKRYQQLLTVENRVFADDIQEVSYDKIPILDKDSATTIGNRVMGTMVDMVSQFEVSDRYAQINYSSKPVRVSPLTYGSLIKWFTNKDDGIPGYIRIDMTTQQAECIRLEQGIRYSAGDHFGRNIYRHLRFAYPTYMFDDIYFEIDESGTPYWICPVKKYNIGLFGGVTIGRVVLCNAISGELTDYAVEDVPQWVDKVYSAEMLIRLYDYHGILKHGYFNSILGQRDCLQTTDGYNYVALEDDVWVYTGITSVGQDESNVGFVLMNQRTMETRYYEISGAEEYSAMSSAEGRVQHLGYKATFPLILNIGGEPTYFMALKDDAGLVKNYAMLNIEKYQTVAIGDTVAECERNYIQMMADNGITVAPEPAEKSVTGKIARIVPTVVGGNSHYYVVLEESDVIYDIDVVENPDVILYSQGDEITLVYRESGKVYSAVVKKK